MTVYQHKNGRWYYKFQINGKEINRAAKGAKDRRQAEKVEAVEKSKVCQGIYGLEEMGKMLFDELKEVFIKYTKENKRSWQRDMSALNHLTPYFKGKQLKEIAPFMVEGYRAERKKQTKVNGEPIKPATVNREIEILRKMFNIAIDNEWTDKNPASARKVKPLREDNKKERYLEPDEEVRLLNECTGYHSYLKPIIICALHTGMRKSEILGLRWDCVDFKEKYLTLLDTKSGKVRKIPVSQTLLDILKALSKNRSSEFVFTNPETGKPYVDFKKSFNTICKNAGIENLVFHDLRRTAGTRMANSGVDLVVVQSILGHAEIKTTMRYARPVPEQKLKAIEVLDNYSKINESTIDKSSQV
ncbi:MAG: hypothetical protein A2287_05215 [Candidatus Melainabacteria bacterium RIFOXYA12_FULL_32_12]|nr:MAG: hypothetical protein A2287_05215 [Candidatus Melainabacteria bacterium RIFOXYA12_FULL_32_12]